MYTNMGDEVIIGFKEGKVAGYNGLSALCRPPRPKHIQVAWLDGHRVGAAMRRADWETGVHPEFLDLERIHKRERGICPSKETEPSA